MFVKLRSMFIAILVVTMGFSSFVAAQGVTTAELSGIITAYDGSPLPGANVVLVHEPSGIIDCASDRSRDWSRAR